MKQKLLSRLIVGAIAGVAAAGVAQAGQITASSTNVAREVITTDTLPINSPTISYRFAGDIDATVQAQEFQVQWTLEDGALWDTIPSDDAITITPTAGTDAGVVGVGATNFAVTAKGLSADKTTLWATITVPVAPVAPWTDSLLDQPIITVNAAGATTDATIINLKTLVGDLVNDYNTSGICSDNKSLFVNFAHFKLLSNPAAIAGAGNGVADEHERSGSTNRAGIINFPTNLLVQFATSTGTTKVDVSAANLAFVGTATGAEPAYISPTLANLGTLTLVQNATGYDTDLTNQYLLTGNPAGSGLTDAATATLNDGNVEVAQVTVDLTASNGFVSGGNVFLATDALCAAPIAGSNVAITAANAAGPISLPVPTGTVNPSFGVTGTGPIRVCYDVTGVATPIPLSSFSAVGTVVKSAAGVNLNEQNNICNGNLYSLGGGIKIDVRNYANSQDPSGWMSVIRLINNNESRTVDVYGQLIQTDGLYGPWGLIATLAPRAVVNMTASEIDALLVNAPEAGAANGDSAPQSTSTGARLRVTSENASSLRVQNYMYNPATGAVMEFSSSQGVDYEGTVDRAPLDSGGAANSGQYISQDAQAGLNGK